MVVTDPDGNPVPVTFVGMTPLAGGALAATYSIPAPGGTWDVADDGVYALAVAANQVADLDGNFVRRPYSADRHLPPADPRRHHHGRQRARQPPGGVRRGGRDRVGRHDRLRPGGFGTPQTISLMTPLAFQGPDGGALTVTGPGMDQLTVQRDSGATTDFRVVYSAAPSLTLTGFTISGGTDLAAAAASFGTTVLDHMALTGNSSADFGGGLYIGDNQSAVLRDSIVSGNTAATDGGGIIVSRGAHLTIERTTVSGNSAASGVGGGILVNPYGVLDVVDSTISGNSAGVAGGGIYLNTGATLRMDHSVLADNSAGFGGGGVFAYRFGAIELTATTVSGNSADSVGGGVCFYNGGSLLIADSTISGNTTSSSANNYGGGGVYFFGFAAGPLVIQNTTIANNHSGSSGGAVLLNTFYGELDVFDCTISGNTAGNTNAGQGGGGLAMVSGPGSIFHRQ